MITGLVRAAIAAHPLLPANLSLWKPFLKCLIKIELFMVLSRQVLREPLDAFLVIGIVIR
jgi:hypothetical protein